jgi:D-lactate dehydrogenase (cytochrome)
MRYCHEHRIAVVPQGGNTGLVYGGVPLQHELILSLTRLVSVQILRDTMTATCGAGVVLQTLQEQALAEGLLVPLDLGAKGSCTLGGNIATKAGGIKYARYGSMRSNTLGLEVVRSDGTILDMMCSVRKDNTGCDLKQSFIGSEGTLGVVTAAVLKLHPAPSRCDVALLRVSSFAEVLRVWSCAQTTVCDSVSAFEVMDGAAMDVALPSHHRGFGVLIELSSCGQGDDGRPSGFEPLVTELDRQGVVLQHSSLAVDETQRRDLWGIREKLPVQLAQLGTITKFDLCFPLHLFYDVVPMVRDRVQHELGAAASDVVVTGYGHFGDGNVHLNVIDKTRGHTAAVERALATVYDFAALHGGSISAEHGIGVLKKEALRKAKPPAVLAAMREVKAQWDPRGILNPGKVIDM